MDTVDHRVRVVAPARLHMGFLDPSGEQGRRFGSLGVALNEIATRLSIHRASQLKVTGPQHLRAMEIARNFLKKLQLPESFSISVESAIPEHVGLGSGTQLSIAIGLGLSVFFGLDHGVRDIAQWTARGARSGIGVAMFEQGGFIVDGGRSKTVAPPPVVSRIDVPGHWRFILVFDQRGQGLSGVAEVKAFEKLPPFPVAETAHLCHLILLQALPALAENDIRGFGEVISEVQRSGGDYFAGVQGGRFISPDVQQAIEWLGDRGAVGLGQTSWGPTGFCIIEGVERAEALLYAAVKEFSGEPALSFQLVSARNRGGDVTTSQADFDLCNGDSGRYPVSA